MRIPPKAIERTHGLGQLVYPLLTDEEDGCRQNALHQLRLYSLVQAMDALFSGDLQKGTKRRLVLLSRGMTSLHSALDDNL